jgi:hypothetical protein
LGDVVNAVRQNMGRAPDQDAEQLKPPAPEPAAEPVGRVEVDARGRNVWRWARDVIDSTSVLLKRLDNKDLALEPTQKVPVARADPASKPGEAAKGARASTDKKSARDAVTSDKAAKHPALQRQRRGDGGFDPYNSR